MDLRQLTSPIVQISLDLTDLDEALSTAQIAVDAGVDWLEAGTPLIQAAGAPAVRALHERFPTHPIIADLKIMDGGYRETELMAKAGASFVVVMGRAHEATVRYCVDAGRAFGIQVMGDNMLADDRVANARWLASLGVDVVIHHIGYDERRLVKGLSPLDELAAVVAAVDVPVQAVGGLSIAQAIACPSYGAPLVVLGAPLVIAADDFKPSGSDLGSILREICSEIRKTPMAPTRQPLDREDRPEHGHHAGSRRPIRARAAVRRAPRDSRPRDRRARRAAAGRRRLGVRLGRAPVPRHPLVGGQRPGRARPRVLRHRRQGRARRARRQGRRSRRQRDRRRDLRHVHDVPHRPLQPVPDPQGLRLRRQRRDGLLRRHAGALPARDSRHAALRVRLPVRAARRRLPVDVRQLDDPARATWSSSSARDRSACCARGWRRSPAPTR